MMKTVLKLGCAADEITRYRFMGLLTGNRTGHFERNTKRSTQNDMSYFGITYKMQWSIFCGKTIIKYGNIRMLSTGTLEDMKI